VGGRLGLDPRWGLTGVRVAIGRILLTAGIAKLREGTGVTAGRFATWGSRSRR
jgi:hypothetical protein